MHAIYICIKETEEYVLYGEGLCSEGRSKKRKKVLGAKKLYGSKEVEMINVPSVDLVLFV